MKRIVGVILLAALVLAVPPLDGKERGFTAEYRAYYGSMRGASTVFTLERWNDDEWLWQSRSEPAGVVSMFRDDIITERSRFRVVENGIQALDYRYHHREGGDTRRQRHLAFDLNDGIVRFNDDGDRGELEVPAHSLDRFLAQYVLMRSLANDERPEGFHIVDRDRQFEQALDYAGEERIRTRAGRFDTVRVDLKDADSERVLSLWMAPELDYLPVKLEQSEPGERTVRMELESSDR
ncbi:DUF3108 domain-containing protein [Gammaproteobacteria bacterium AB-CW1]|uniref:DUF3108 domain-containing protein n=1 Tax=Natronospira elongata TaxID=3110268 RepID=A0AAP6JE46_9GAMM|nr:DUF3108 domain-containing protein [Gammaproteobacteria bacterium AB-CW1]